jgi:transposase
MLRSGVISDELWDVIEPVLPTDSGRAGRPWADHRLILEGILWRYRVGAPWRDLPVQFGPWQTVWKRHRRWSFDGTYERIFVTVQEVFGRDTADSEPIRKLLSIDSTTVRAHQHAAGARNDVLTASAVKKGSVELQEFPARAG